jgi:hypothetical protein
MFLHNVLRISIKLILRVRTADDENRKKYRVGKTCSTPWDINALTVSSAKLELKGKFGRPRHVWEENIKICLKTLCGSVN